MDKEFEALKKKVDELEKQIKQKSLDMFGRSYSQVGSSSSDFLIKTKGQVKIQWGSKFIDLIKDGKINANSKFIYIRDEVGSKDGIYVSTNGQSVILKAGDAQINLLGEVGTTYVSFLGAQNSTSEQKHQALTNIGFLYPNLDSIDSNSLQNGIIYIESEHKLYIVQEGKLTELSLEIPSPYTEQFIIAKNDSKQGAIFIQGTGISNSLAFDNFYIYYQEQSAYFKSPYSFIFTIGDSDILKIDSSSVTTNQQVVSSMFRSSNSSSTYGFRLYTLSGVSTLEVDNLVVRNGISSTSDTYPTYWWADSNVVSSVEFNTDSYDLTLRYINAFEVGDCLYTFVNQQGEDQQDQNEQSTISREVVSLTVTQSSLDTIRVTSNSSINYYNLNNAILFKINVGTLIRNSNKGLDIVNSNSFEDEQNIQNIHTRIGNLSDLNLYNIVNGQEHKVEDKNGVYSQNGIFKVIQYASDYNLLEDDNSSNLASTEWITKFVNNLLPVGSIIAFSGSSIPENWALCDGNNGTPNLVGKFIKAESSTGEEGGEEEITIEIENLPSHTHTVTSGSITTSTDGEHSHTVQYSSGNPGVTEEGSDAFVGTGTTDTSESGSHSHTVNLSGLQLSNVGENKPIEWEPKYFSLMFIMRIK